MYSSCYSTKTFFSFKYSILYARFVCFQQCTVSPSCARRGMHAHHPRDCLFFLRDWDTVRLQQLLLENNVNYEAGVRGLPVQGMIHHLQRNLCSAVHRSRRAGAGAGVLTYFAGAGAGAGVCSPPVKL